MQRQSINTAVCAVAVFIVIAVAAVAIILRNDTSINSLTDSSSTGNAIQLNNNNSSLLEQNASNTYPWTLSKDSSNKTNDDIDNDEIITNNHDGSISDFISISDIARGIATPIKSSTRSNKCTDSDKSLLRFTLITDNYPVRFVCNFFVLFVHILLCVI